MSRNPDIVELRLFFENVRCPGVVLMIGYLTSPEGSECIQIGSGTIDPFVIPGEPSSYRLEAIQSLRLGIPGKETPLQSLQKVMKNYELLPPEVLFLFDSICDELVRAISSSIPIKDLPEEERAKFR